jgi:hypothetical protein
MKRAPLRSSFLLGRFDGRSVPFFVLHPLPYSVAVNSFLDTLITKVRLLVA